MIVKMSNAVERTRLVVIGASQVGKTALVKRLLFNTFDEKYKPTIEELYRKEYTIGRIPLKLDILDTAGDLQFPAMRRLSIATADAFLLVYAVDDASSFDILKSCFNEIQDQRQDYPEIPIVIAGNKIDVDSSKVVVEPKDVRGWITQHSSDVRAKVMECSAKQNSNVEQVFRSYLELSKGLAYEPKTASRNLSSGRPEYEIPDRHRRRDLHSSTSVSVSPPKSFARFGSLNPNQLSAEESSSPMTSDRPRSRSLVRRCSKKIKKGVQDASDGPGECQAI